MIRTNVGKADKLVRIVLAIVLGILWGMKAITGVVGIIALVAAVVLLATSFFGVCLLYSIAGISTCPLKK